MWPLSWCWPLKTTECRSSRCGTSVLPLHPLKSLRTTHGQGLNGLCSFQIVLSCCRIYLTYFLLAFSCRGILSISWSQADSELLLSSAKDNRILCWNPNTGDVWDNQLLLLCYAWIILHSDDVDYPVFFSFILGHLWAPNNKSVVLRCPVVPQESSPPFCRLIWWQNHCLLCYGRKLEGSAARFIR